MIYNCHTHIFNIKCAPEKFLTQYVGNFAGSLLMPILKTKVGAKIVLFVTKNPFLRKYTSFLQIGTSISQDTIFNNLSGNYPAETRFVVLTINFDFMGAGPSSLKYEGQLAQVVEIKKKFPNTCLPFLSLDPRMGNKHVLLAFLQKYIRLGFVGVKLYPSLGFFPFDQNFELVYEYAEKAGIPILTHCTKGGIYFNSEITNYMMEPTSFTDPPLVIPGVELPFKTTGLKNDVICDYFLHPANYEVVLSKFPKLKICIAHYGGDDQMLLEGSSWYQEVKRLMSAYENVYTDVSFSLHNEKVFKLIKLDMQDPKLQKRILFGTDYFMTEQHKPEKKLAVELAQFLGPETFKKIALFNPREFLSSTVYQAP
jgi:uncharacterized protein